MFSHFSFFRPKHLSAYFLQFRKYKSITCHYDNSVSHGSYCGRGDWLFENLMNQEVLQKTLLSDEIVQRVHSSLREFFAGLQNSDESLREFLQRYVSEEDVRKMALSVKNDLGSQVSTHLMTAHLGSEIAHVAVVHVLDKMRLSENIVVRNVEVDDKQGIGDFLKKGFAMLFNKQAKKVFSDVLSALASPVEQLLAKNIDQMMESHAPEMTAKLIDRQTENLLDTSLFGARKNKLTAFAHQWFSFIEMWFPSVCRKCLKR